MDFPILETERLYLRQITVEDATALFSTFSRSDVTRYYGMEPFTSIEQAEHMVKSFAEGFEAKRSMRWGISLKGEPTLLGTIGLNNWNTTHRRAEVGYELHPDYWSKGYVTEAIQAITTYSFSELQLVRLGATVFPENPASVRVLEKNGFEKEGILRNYLMQNGTSHDVWMLAKLPY
ncbi:GNAT family protein [Ectobacillus antri]|jgi:ribosomal-protein-alanine N-acetyltransferase|uniref:GNAT family protein n=1 Tax=Ectobacillus antri TaxID=2486280 RepID=A0ABT6H9F1_9BACI|nr:GNAT family protein [Ectobacillus antri]MDG4658430.1 GNAT family protein [Ectobacillus antri]MDG5755433.1 GNAT family protein [Ectobacillus antri]